MRTLTYPIEQFNELELKPGLISEIIKIHRAENLPKITKCNNYYSGEHDIAKRTKKSSSAPNNKVVCNHAKDIVDTATGYFMSSAITFSSEASYENALDVLTTAFDKADIDEVDHDNALDMSVCGIAYEYVYLKQDEFIPVSKNMDPGSTIMVYDDTIEQNELFALYYNVEKSPIDKDKDTYKAVVMTKNYIYNMQITTAGELVKIDDNAIPHNLGDVPLIVYQNNKKCFGDFELQISLIDAYNTLTSDRINDKEQFLDALLVMYGARLGDDVEETSEALKLMREEKIIDLPEGAKLEYLLRQLDENGAEILRKAIKEDIYSFSHVPNMTDTNFVGNSSGVAMEYKLLPLESITKTKSRYYTKGMKKRMKLYATSLGLSDIQNNQAAIIPTFKRGLPKNLLELSQVISNLKGFVSKKTLLNQIPFVEDPENEIQEVEKENAENIKNMQDTFGGDSANNEPPLSDEQQ